MNLIHLGTKISTVFAVLDPEGNVGQTFPLSIDLRTLSASSFLEALGKIQEKRGEILKPPGEGKKGVEEEPNARV